MKSNITNETKLGKGTKILTKLGKKGKISKVVDKGEVPAYILSITIEISGATINVEGTIAWSRDQLIQHCVRVR